MSLKHIRSIIADQTGMNTSQINNKTLIEELAIDDLDLADIYITLEDFYDIEISEEQIYEFEKVGDIIKYIEENAEEDSDDFDD